MFASSGDQGFANPPNAFPPNGGTAFANNSMMAVFPASGGGAGFVPNSAAGFPVNGNPGFGSNNPFAASSTGSFTPPSHVVVGGSPWNSPGGVNFGGGILLFFFLIN